MSWIRTAAAGLALAAGLWAQGAGAVEVKNVKAEYAWPWGAYINYEVVGTIATNDPLIVKATDRTKNVTYIASASALSGDTGTAAGKHLVVWDLDKQGINIQSTNVVFTVEYRGAWCVVDLSAGANATSYPVTYLNDPPSGGFNTDTYKTTKLVLRRIEPGTFTMGSTSERDNKPHQVTLTKPFYIGVFEVTQKQYQLVTGSNPSEFSGDTKPVEWVSWNSIRGDTNWPASSTVSASSFMGKLRTRTGLVFDLPTEAQWEYACRAGTTNSYNVAGVSLDKLGQYYGNGTFDAWGNFMYWGETTVGNYLSNAWGLYDMHGNVWEWCLDWKGDLTNDATDPKGLSAGTYRVLRGGSWVSELTYCASSFRFGVTPGSSKPKYENDHGPGSLGFRLVRCSLPEEER